MAGTQLGEAFVPIRATLDKLDGDLAAARGKVEGAMGKIGQIAGTVGGNLQTFGKIALGALGVVGGAALAAAGGMAALAASAEPLVGLQGAFATITERIGSNSETMLRALQDASGGLITNRDLMTSFNKAAALVSDDFANRLPDAMSLVRKAAQATGQDMGFLFDSLVTGVGRVSPMILDNLGIQVSLAEVTERAAEMFGKQADELSKTEQQAALTEIVMEKLNDVYGDVPDAAMTFAEIRTSITNLKDEIGLKLLPVMAPLAEAFLNLMNTAVGPLMDLLDTRVLPVVEKITYAIGRFIENLLAGQDPLSAISDLLAMLAIALGGNSESAMAVRDAFNQIVEAVQGIIETVSPYIEMAWDWISQNVELSDVLIALGLAIASVVVPAIISVVAAAAPILLTFAALVAAVALVRTAWENNWGGIRDKTQVVMDWLKKFIPDAISTVRDFIDSALDKIKGFWEDHGDSIMTIVNFFMDGIKTIITGGTAVIQGIWSTFGGAIESIIDNTVEFVKSSWQNLMDFIGEVLDAVAALIQGDWEEFGDKLANAAEIFLDQLADIWETAWENISTVAAAAWEGIQALLAAAADALKAMLMQKVATFVEIGREIVAGIRRGVENAWNSFLNWIGNLLGDALIQWVKKQLGISSPSKVFADIGRDIALGLAEGIRAEVAAIAAASEEAINIPLEVAEGILSAAGKLGSIGSGFANRYESQFMDPLRARMDELDDALENQRQNMIDLFGLDPLSIWDIPSLVWSDDPEIRRRFGIWKTFQEQRNAAEREYIEMQERLARLQEQQANLQFLQQQLDLLNLITEHGLDAEAILGGLQLGLDANLEELIDAMIAAMQELVGQAEEELGVASPSKVFRQIGEQVMAGLTGGIMSGVDRAIGAISSASEALIGAGRRENVNYWQLTIHEAGDRGNVIQDFEILKALSGA